jgi:hypothetical protein
VITPRRSVPIKSGLLIAVLLLLVASRSSAQSLEGQVLDSATGNPVAGGMVLLIGPHDSIFAGSATTERGSFSLALVPPGRYRIRVLRIGSRAWLSPELTLANGQRRVERLLISSEPVILAEITVRANSSCRADPNADADVAVLWEEARKGLRLTDANVSNRLLEYRSTVTTRRTDPSRRLSTSESLGRVGFGAWPVGSLSGDSLAAAGFVQPTDSIRGPRYYGPDARVFFSEAFLRTHCFRAVAPRDRDSTQIGVGFEPVKTRTLPDIEGVLWLDRQSAELRRLEFHYTGLWRWVPPGSVGGDLDFVRLDSGAWIISHWRMNAPVARAEPLPLGFTPEPDERRFFGAHKVRLAGYLEEEGRVEEVRIPDSVTVWRAP